MSQQRTVVLFVEGAFDARVVRELVRVAGFGAERVQVEPVGGKGAITRVLRYLKEEPGRRYAVLVDADAHNLPDAQVAARRELGDPPVEVFAAVPAVESWLFADEDAVRVAVEGRTELLGLPLPEEIPYPKLIAKRLFGSRENALRVFEHYDLPLAASRSPSLRVFVEGLGRLLGEEQTPVADSYARSMGRDVFSNLLAEVTPGDAVVYRTVDGTSFTAGEMIRQVREGTEIGRQYSSDVLRISRDFLARKAQREAAR